MLKFLRIFQGDVSSPTHIIIFIVDGEFNFLFALTDLVVFLIFSLIEFDINFYGPGQSSKEGTYLFLNS